MNTRICAFTLIELLVVITIIVVLLALLTPALDKAIYQAELVSCAGRLNAHGSQITSYAFDFKRYYPARTAFTGSHPWINTLRGRTQAGQWLDDRPLLFERVDSSLFLDPLCSDEIDLEDDSLETVESTVTSTYTPYYGVNYVNGGSLRRYGDSLTWHGQKFNVLVTDQDWASGLITTGSHQDKNPALMELWTWQNDPLLLGPEGTVISAAAGYNFIMARWQHTNHGGAVGIRGTVDANFAKQDGSVVRYNDLPRDARNAEYDGAIGRLPVAFNSPINQTEQFNGIWFQAPQN